MKSQLWWGIPALAVMGMLALPASHAASQSNLSIQAIQQITGDDNRQDMTNAATDFEYDAAQCVAYYGMAQHMAEGVNQKAASKAGAALKDTAHLTAVAAGAIGMNMQTVKAQIQIDITRLTKQFGPNYVDAPTVVESIGGPCKSLVEHPVTRMVYWVKVEQKRRLK